MSSHGTDTVEAQEWEVLQSERLCPPLPHSYNEILSPEVMALGVKALGGD